MYIITRRVFIAKRYEEWTKLCYALQASRYNITSSNVYITLSLIVSNTLAKVTDIKSLYNSTVFCAVQASLSFIAICNAYI